MPARSRSGAAGVGGSPTAATTRTARPVGSTSGVPLPGRHQAGITTPAQDRLHFAAFDVTTTSREELIALLREWTAAAREMTKGVPIGRAVPTPYDAPPTDTGEALGLTPPG